MRLRDFLIASTLMSLQLIAAPTTPPPALIDRCEYEVDHVKPSAPTPTVLLPAPSVLLPVPALVEKDKVLESAYYNTLAILSTSNRCSDFFGGSEASMNVFQRLVGQVRNDYVSSSIAMRMYGPTINFQSAQTSLRYRLFNKVSINSNGPFYKRAVSRSDRTVFRIGTFEPNTPEVRILILLHELGHAIKGQDGKWLLPDDGDNEGLSRYNTRKMEEICGDQIKGVGDAEALRNLAMRNQPDEKVALDSNVPNSLP